MLDFVGKSGVEHHLELDDPDLVAAMEALLSRSSTAKAVVFATCVEQAVDAIAVNRYLAEHTGGEVTAKDLRTWGATAAMVDYLCSRSSPGLNRHGPMAPDELVREAIAQVAELLGNTVAVCSSSYIAPRIIDAYHSGELTAMWRRRRRGRWMSRAERTTLGVLDADMPVPT